MRKKIIKLSLFIIGGILIIVLGLFATLWIVSPGKAGPVTDLQGKPWVQGDHSIFLQYGRLAITVSSEWFIENISSQELALKNVH